MSFYCLFGEGKSHLLGGPGPTVCVFQKILGLMANVMDKFGHLGVSCVCPVGVRLTWVCGCWHPDSHRRPRSYLSGAAFARRGLEFSTQSRKPEIAMMSSSCWTDVC